MTPAVKQLQKAKVPFVMHEYQHDPRAESYGLEAAEKLGLNPEQVYKTLVVSDEQQLYVAIVPVTGQLNLKSMAKAVGVKKLQMADKNKVQSTTGYVLGGVSPFGQKKRLKTVLDASADAFEQIYVSGGKRGLDVEVAPADLMKVLAAQLAAIKD